MINKMMYKNNESPVEAIVYLKNGKRKYGILIGQPDMEENYGFISNDHRKLFMETSNPEFIEFLPGSSIDGIDIDFK